MNLPREEHWLRVEELADELGALSKERAASRISELAGAGESPTVLTLLGSWLVMPPPPAPISSGGIVGGRYTLRQKLGEGGMGTVWRAKQEMIGRDVALKIIHPPLVTPALRARFLGEMEALGHLDHPGIVKIFDAGMHEEEGLPAVPFFVMEVVEGRVLNQWAESHRRDPVGLLRVASALCAAVQNAHERQIVHRDLKPANILVRKDGQPVVLDFGIARLAGIALGEDAGKFSGTPQYAAPEQHLGRDHDFRSGESVDVYAVGAILFEMLSGRRLFEFPRGTSFSEMRRAVLEDPPPRLSEVMPKCPDFLDELVARAVRREPSDRFYSMSAFGRAISRALAQFGPVDTISPPWSPAPGAIVPGTHWKLAEKIGEGGAGQVWIGQHDQLGERRVFKFCDTEEKARTLKRELTLFRLLKERVGRNPHFVPLHEVSLDEPPWYLMMDHVEARDLESWCEGQRGGLAGVPENLRLEIVAQAAEALQAAHEAGILHRDIKPANLLVRGNGTQIHVLVADFGIGQLAANEFLRGGTRMGFTQTVADLRGSALSGTMLYLAPELLEGNAATARSDIYSLGVVLWQLLAGNLNAALDPADWANRIDDPLLREDLNRCLAGNPDKRWEAAGELASRLRALPERRAAEARRRAELAAREREAYQRGIIRTAAVAVGILGIVAGLAWTAWQQRLEAEHSRGQIVLEHASTLRETDHAAGRRANGLQLLNSAILTVTNRAALRSAAAKVLGMPDLVPAPTQELAPTTEAASSGPSVQGELFRTMSRDGAMSAVARDLDGLNGAIDLVKAGLAQKPVTITRKLFPWVPVPEQGMLQFSSDSKLLAVGGAATSRHVLVFNVPDGSLKFYAFHGSDPLSCAWHPGSRVMVTGCADGMIRVWDITIAASASRNAPPTNQFDLPPALDVPALDIPSHILRGHGGPVQHLTFSRDGRWLASLDGSGYLRIYGGFTSGGLPAPSLRDHATELIKGYRAPEPGLVVEKPLENVEQVTGLSAFGDFLVIERRSGKIEKIQFVEGKIPAELPVAPGITDLAWNSNGTEICAITLTDIHWFHVSPLENFFTSSGKNPIGVQWQSSSKYWALPTGNEFTEFIPEEKDGAWNPKQGLKFTLTEAEKGQGAVASIVAAEDGRVAIYHGSRIQFFLNHQAAPEESSLTTKGGGGKFQELIWDKPGELLGVAFASANGLLHLESWKTSKGFPPKASALQAVDLDCQKIVPANDRRSFLARSAKRGLFRFDPETRAEITVNTSISARQIGPLSSSSDGSLLALVRDQNTIQLLTMPTGTLFADLVSPRPTSISGIFWDTSGQRLASITDDDFIQAWNLAPWRKWITENGLEK